jgi:CubicO group peptidase (beta-lactamase class C family)
VQTSARDYARWIAFLLSAWPARDGPETGPVRRASVREMAHGSNFPQSDQRTGPAGQPCHVASAYGMGLSAERDCELGTILSHSGGYPGYGSYMMLLPERGIGLFAFTNGTYSAPVPQLVEAAALLHRTGLIPPRPVPQNSGLTTAYRTAGAIYAAGSVEPGRPLLAMNFLMDRSAEHWRRDLAQLKQQVGECRTDAPVQPVHNLLGRFSWTCERGTLRGALMLAPTDPAGIQSLRFRVVPPPAPAR